MAMSLEQLISAIQERQPRSHAIRWAADYVKTIFACRDEACSVSAQEWATEEQWQELLKSTASQPTYSHPDMVVDLKSTTLAKTEGACLDFACVLTTTSKDRDGDILESAGAILDERMPLLWQHIAFQPIGKYVKTISQSAANVVIQSAIIDTPFGRDVAQLVEFDALRMSHGFRPVEWKRLPDTDKEPWPGFHITKFNVFEASLVSVPANSEAIVLAHSRGKLHTPLIKSWAKSVWEQQPQKVTGGFASVETETEETGLGSPEIALNDPMQKSHRCTCQTVTREKVDPETADQLASKLIGRLLQGNVLDANIFGALQETVADQEHKQKAAVTADFIKGLTHFRA